MSTQEQKIEVITEWLERQAKQGRLTNVREIGQAAGLFLAEKGYRKNGSSAPVQLEDVLTALNTVAANSAQANGFILPALVVHFSDKKPGQSRFLEFAEAAGIPLDEEADYLDVWSEQVAKVFAFYAAPAVTSLHDVN